MPALDAPGIAPDLSLTRDAGPRPASGSAAPQLRIPFDNTYARLPERFYARQHPTPVAAPRLVRVNRDLAEALGIDPDALESQEGVEVLAGNRIADGSEPLAQAYAGHQFGGFTPQLGDGRAILLGEVVGRDGQRRDIQLKGSGRTPFSRGGDGRAALGPVLREYLVSEAMTALGIPSTRALAAVTTGDKVYREAGALPGAVITRVAASHLRVGTFQYFAARRDEEALRILAEYALARHYPDAVGAERPALALLEGVIARQAELVAAWMGVGFIHGVMNTDNSSISGETIDFGPCAFMDAYDPATVFSSIDHMGRYAYGNQPRIALWNATRLAEALLPLLGDTEDAALAAAQDALGRFAPRFEAAHLGNLRRKVGLGTDQDGDSALLQDLLERMAANAVDFTLLFRGLCDAATGPEGDADVRALFADPAAYDAWAARWRARLAAEPSPPQERRTAMQAVNPARIPRNYLVEEALTAAVEHGDTAPWEAMLDALVRPYEDRPGLDRYAAPSPAEHREGYRTFCGT